LFDAGFGFINSATGSPGSRSRTRRKARRAGFRSLGRGKYITKLGLYRIHGVKRRALMADLSPKEKVREGLTAGTWIARPAAILVFNLTDADD
jgi:hypothetical protein